MNDPVHPQQSQTYPDSSSCLVRPSRLGWRQAGAASKPSSHPDINPHGAARWHPKIGKTMQSRGTSVHLMISNFGNQIMMLQALCCWHHLKTHKTMKHDAWILYVGAHCPQWRLGTRHGSDAVMLCCVIGTATSQKCAILGFLLERPKSNVENDVENLLLDFSCDQSIPTRPALHSLPRLVLICRHM